MKNVFRDTKSQINLKEVIVVALCFLRQQHKNVFAYLGHSFFSVHFFSYLNNYNLCLRSLSFDNNLFTSWTNNTFWVLQNY
jgi:hypothetical protein